MAAVADQVQTFINREEDIQARQAAGEQLPDVKRFHHMFMAGPPGTGKTTVAEGLAAVLKDLGVIKENKVVAEHASSLVGQYEGEAQTNMNAAVKKAKGGILFIDEAHQLADNQYGKMALRALIKPMSDPDSDVTVILAGYSPDPLYKVDPGLKSRTSTVLRFNRFTGDQLTEFADSEVNARRKLTFANDESYDAMADAMDAIADRPDHASMRDAVNLINYADDARVARNHGKPKLSLKKRKELTADDWAVALERFHANNE